MRSLCLFVAFKLSYAKEKDFLNRAMFAKDSGILMNEQMECFLQKTR